MRLLIVEDDAPVARTLARMLREDGFEVELAFDGAAAIAGLGRKPVPDVVVVDYRLPHVDGMAVAAYARSRRPGVPVIFVSSYPEVLREVQPKLDPAPLVLMKPLIYGDLTSELKRMQ